jgi:hypothetical protein
MWYKNFILYHIYALLAGVLEVFSTRMGARIPSECGLMQSSLFVAVGA